MYDITLTYKEKEVEWDKIDSYELYADGVLILKSKNGDNFINTKNQDLLYVEIRKNG